MSSFATYVLTYIIQLPLIIGRWFLNTLPVLGLSKAAALELPKVDGPCRFPLDIESSRILNLDDGRNLSYAEYGSSTGIPVIYLHGLPGSRIEAASMHNIVNELNIRIVSIDRPGIGRSSPMPERGLLDHAQDVEKVADHLGFEQFAAIGVSGGGPYALACARALPANRLIAVCVVCGLGPPEAGFAGMSITNSLGFRFAWRYTPSLVRWYFGRHPAARLDLDETKRLEQTMKLVNKHIVHAHPKDKLIFQDVDRIRLWLRSSNEVYRQDFTTGLAIDGRLLSAEWDFRLEDIRSDLPVRLWYGRLDDNVPPGHGEHIAARLRGYKTQNVKLMIEDETHASISALRMHDILSDLKEAMRI